MARFADRDTLLPPEVLERFKWRIAEDLGLAEEIARRGWAEMPSRELGRIGGHLGGATVRALIRRAEEALAKGEPLP